MIVGGGGGAGGGGGPGGNGGAGGSSDTAGTAGASGFTVAQGGQPGTSSAAGTGGTVSPPGSGAGVDGTGAAGGAGGSNADGGGGGGGGYFGGGGGGGGDTASGAGGGGGANFGPAGAQITAAARSGNGVVTVSYVAGQGCPASDNSYWVVGVRRRDLRLRRRRLLRVDGRHAPRRARRGHRRDPRRQRLLGGGVRRRDLRLRRRRLLRVDGRQRTSTQPVVGIAATPDGNGYWVVGVRRRDLRLRRRRLPRVDGRHAPQRARRGHRRDPRRQRATGRSASDGGIFAFGDAGFFGSMGATHLNAARRGHRRDPRRQGLLGGGLRRRDLRLRRRRLPRVDGRQAPRLSPSSGIAATSDGNGYWVVASDGGIFAFGDAVYSGSMGAKILDARMAGMAAPHAAG